MQGAPRPHKQTDNNDSGEAHESRNRRVDLGQGEPPPASTGGEITVNHRLQLTRSRRLSRRRFPGFCFPELLRKGARYLPGIPPDPQSGTRRHRRIRQLKKLWRCTCFCSNCFSRCHEHIKVSGVSVQVSEKRGLTPDTRNLSLYL